MSASPTAPASRPRVATWDNARFILIILVVIGHLISTVRTDSSFAFGVYTYIYLFHMPAMLLLSGMFSKADTRPKAIVSTCALIATWLLWEGIWAVIHATVEGREPTRNFLVNPAWTLWFLVTLASMRILLPYIARLRHPLLFSVIVSLVSSMFPAIGATFSASRTLALMPFFVAGWLLNDRGVLVREWFARPARAARVWGGVILGAIALALLLLPGIRHEWRLDKWLRWTEDYTSLFSAAPIGGWEPGEWLGITLGGFGVAAALLLVAAAMTFALLMVVPRRRTFFTVWGTRTLFVYLLHGPIIWLLRYHGIVDEIGALGISGVLLLLVIAVVIAAVLSGGWVTKVFWPVIEPRIDWLFVKEKS